MKVHINYAEGKFYNSQKFCTRSAIEVGFDQTHSYGIEDIDYDFRQKNDHILSQKRGAGYWLWKPYFLQKTLNQLEYGDILVYSDSGSYYISSIQPLIDRLMNSSKGVISFELTGLIEKDWTKKDCFSIMGLDEEKYTDSSQREATYIWIIKNDFTIGLIDEYLKYSQMENVITDSPNTEGENYPSFTDHRHDQSIWSLLCKKYEIEKHRPPSQNCLHLIPEFPDDDYGQITFHHRNPI